MTFKVMSERCSECLYGANKIVSDSRRREIIRKTARTDSFFVCHKASIKKQTVCCRGDWDSHGGGQMGRIAGRLNAVEFVDPASYEEA